MLTGPQIREARELIGWSADELSRHAFLKLDVVEAAEKDGGGTALIHRQEAAIRGVFERVGVEFSTDGVRLRKAEL